ncbi:MAG: hypothetical protein ACREAB_09325, partial [Blastocatellia bacterium]
HTMRLPRACGDQRLFFLAIFEPKMRGGKILVQISAKWAKIVAPLLRRQQQACLKLHNPISN